MLESTEERGRERTVWLGEAIDPPTAECLWTSSTTNLDSNGLHPTTLDPHAGSRTLHTTKFDAHPDNERLFRRTNSRSRSRRACIHAPEDPTVYHQPTAQDAPSKRFSPQLTKKAPFLKSIIMGELGSRPQTKRWTSYDPSKQPSKILAHESGLNHYRLTSLYGRESPRSRSCRRSYHHTPLRQTDNTFEDLDRINASDLVHDVTVSPDALVLLETQAVPVSCSRPRGTPTLYTRMSEKLRTAHNSMVSLVTARDTVKHRPLRKKNLVYQSELESDDFSDTANGHNDVNDAVNRYDLKSTLNYDDVDDYYDDRSLLGHSPPFDSSCHLGSHNMDPGVVDSLVTEIAEFQDSFVNKSRPNMPEAKLGRTQQKLVDYKSLYERDQPSFADQKGSAASSYQIRIQSELLTAQYTSIRLRFLEREVAATHSSHTHSVKTTIGVYGFLDRYVAQDQLPVEPDQIQLKSAASSTFPVGKYNHFLKGLWGPTTHL